MRNSLVQKNSVMIVFIIILFSSILTGEEYEIQVPVIEKPKIKIDGYLNEECWKKAASVSEFIQLEPEEGEKPSCETDVLTWTDRTNLYIGFICYDNEPSKLRFSRTERDRFTRGDRIEVQVATDNPPTRVYVLFVNPAGTQIDFLRPNPKQADITFDLDFRSQAQILDDRWTVEIAIPFKSLRFKEAKHHHFRIEYARVFSHGKKDEYSSWIPHTKDEPNTFEKMGHLYIDVPLSVKHSIDFLPYIISAGKKEEGERSFDWRAGLSGKWWLTSNNILDCAIKPDFSQIEADAPQLEINTPFAFYYPEKRPLFMERKDIFDSHLPVVYTRTINDPVAVLKFTGDLSNNEIGYILSRDDQTLWVIPFQDMSFPVQTKEKSLSNILRIKHKFLKDSYIGIVATDRESREAYNRVVSSDGELRFLEKYTFSWQGALSFTREPNDTSIFSSFPGVMFDKYTPAFDGEKFSGNAFGAWLTSNARYFDSKTWYRSYSPTFRADNGFIRYNSRKEGGFNANLKFWPNRYGITYISPGLSFKKSNSYEDNTELKSTKGISLLTLLKNQISFSVSYKINSILYETQKFDELWTFDGNANYIWGNFLLGVYGRKGKEINYFAYPAETGDMSLFGCWFNFTPFSLLKVNLSFGKYQLWNKQGEKTLESSTFISGATYSVSQSATYRLNIQYSQGGYTFLSQLFSFKPTPFTLLYIGSNHTLQTSFSDKEIEQNAYQVFIKGQYLFPLHY